jgi:hypothetical protein
MNNEIEQGEENVELPVDEQVVEQVGEPVDGFDMARFTGLVESNQAIMERLQVGPEPGALLEMRLKAAIMLIGGEPLLLTTELMVQEWLAEGLVETEKEMNRQKLLEGVNEHPSNNIMPMPNMRVVQGDM